MGRNLGIPGYSYDFVAKLFVPLFRAWGEYLEVRRPEENLAVAVDRARRQGAEPVHVCFRGLHDAVLASGALNVVVPAWEFPDVPDHEFGHDPRHNWVAVANACSLVIVGGKFTKDAFQRAGVRTPIEIVPVPIPREYFDVPDWSPAESTSLDCSSVVLQQTERETMGGKPEAGTTTGSHRRWVLRWWPGRREARARLRLAARNAYKRLVRPVLPDWIDVGVTEGTRAAILMLHNRRLTAHRAGQLKLSGIVYTSIFNAADDRKNWEDLLMAFLIGLKDCADATLVLKLISRSPRAVNAILAKYRGLDLHHRCKLVIVSDYLRNEELLDLTRASTYYVTSTRAEGNCLPLMNYLAAGRPGISPCHTAISDYFDGDIGFVVASHPEPAAWPQDPLLRCRTTWHRTVWPSLVEKIRASYRLAKDRTGQYHEMSVRARCRMQQHAHPDRVRPRLHAAIDSVFEHGQAAESPVSIDVSEAA
jgi:hypothetical protein